LAVYFQFHGDLDLGAYRVHVVTTPFTVHGVLPYNRSYICASVSV